MSKLYANLLDICQCHGVPFNACRFASDLCKISKKDLSTPSEHHGPSIAHSEATQSTPTMVSTRHIVFSVLKLLIIGAVGASALALEPRSIKDYPKDVSGVGNAEKPDWGGSDFKIVPKEVSRASIIVIKCFANEHQYKGKCSVARQECDFGNHKPVACMPQQPCKKDGLKCGVYMSHGKRGPAHCQNRST